MKDHNIIAVSSQEDNFDIDTVLSGHINFIMTDECDKYLVIGLSTEELKKLLIGYSNNRFKLPDFLYEDDGEIKIGVHGDSVVTNQWNKWKEDNFYSYE